MELKLQTCKVKNSSLNSKRESIEPRTKVFISVVNALKITRLRLANLYGVIRASDDPMEVHEAL